MLVNLEDYEARAIVADRLIKYNGFEYGEDFANYCIDIILEYLADTKARLIETVDYFFYDKMYGPLEEWQADNETLEDAKKRLESEGLWIYEGKDGKTYAVEW